MIEYTLYVLIGIALIAAGYWAIAVFADKRIEDIENGKSIDF